MKPNKYLPVVAVALVALFSQPSLADSADLRFSIGEVSFGIDIGLPPPPPVVEYVPVAVPGHVWVPGYWAWDGRRHVWSGGVWERIRPGYSHVAGHWERRADRWHFEPSRWEAHDSAKRHGDKYGYAPFMRYDGHRDHVDARDRDSRRNYR